MKTILALAVLALLVTFTSGFGQTTGQMPAWTDAIPQPAKDEKCTLTPQRGPCKAMFEKFYYSARDRKCSPFFWGGCDGVVPFESLEECEKECVPPETLRISKIEVRDDLYLEVSLEFPRNWDNPFFEVLVNDKDVNVSVASGGFSGDRQMQSLLFFPGGPGTKQITVHATLANRGIIQAKGTFNWPGRPFVALLGYPGDRLLVTGSKKIRIVAANIENVTIKINGEQAKPGMVGRDALLFSVDPRWKAGPNVVSVEGKGADGTPVTKSYRFVYSGNGIKQGEALLLDYGTEGTKSGPFYSLSVEGDALALGKERTAHVYTIDREGWIGQEIRLVREVKAVKPGRAKVLISEKSHFLQQRQLKEEIGITVLPAGQ